MVLVEIPKYKKVDFQTVEAMYEVFEAPIKEIGLTKKNLLKEFSELKKHYSHDYLFFYHVCWEMILLVEVDYDTINKKDKNFLDYFHKERKLYMKPHHPYMYEKMFDKTYEYLTKYLQ